MTEAIDIDFNNSEIAFSSKSNSALNKTFFIFWLMNINWLTKIGTFFIKLFLLLGLPVKKLIKKTLFSQFCGGENMEECLTTVNDLYEYHVGTILDYSVEGEDNEHDFDATTVEIIRTIEVASKNKEKIPFAVFKISGLGSADLLNKKQLGEESLTKSDLEAYQRIIDRVRKIMNYVAISNVPVLIDAEESWIQDEIDKIALEFMRELNQESVIVFNTYQLYRWEILEELKAHLVIAHKEGFKIGAKIVRGAYLEKERSKAKEEEYKDPIHKLKILTDKDYDLAIQFCLDNINDISLVLGTHNEKSTKFCIELMNEKNINPSDKRVYFAQLLGMSDNISFNLAQKGYNVAKYVPFGPIEAVMPYLFRRAAENSSIAGQTGREFSMLKKELSRRKSIK